jgi:hypothetical protein
MWAITFPGLNPPKWHQELESLHKKIIQSEKLDYLAAKINFAVLIILTLIRLSPFGALISKEWAGTIMLVSFVFIKPIMNFFKSIKSE